MLWCQQLTQLLQLPFDWCIGFIERFHLAWLEPIEPNFSQFLFPWVPGNHQMEKSEHLCTICGNLKCNHYVKQYAGSSKKKFKIELSYHPVIPYLGIYPEELKLEFWRNIFIFTEALFIIAKRWQPTKCSLMDEKIMKRRIIDTMEYSSSIKKKSCHL